MTQNVSFSIDDPGIGQAVDARIIPILIGTATAGSTTEIKSFSKVSEAITEYTSGPLAEALAAMLARGGRPVRALRVNGSIAATTSAVTEAGPNGPNMTVTGTPRDAYNVRVEVVKAGVGGTARVKYTLDAWDEKRFAATFTEEITTTVNGMNHEVALTGTGLTVSWVTADGNLVVGTTYSFTTTAPHFQAAEVTTAYDLIDVYPLPWRFISLVGDPATIAAANTLNATLKTRHEALFNLHKYVLAMTSVSRDTTTNVIATGSSLVSRDIAPLYGMAYMVSSVPIAGRSVARFSATVPAAIRAAASRISTDLSRAASGALSGVLGVTYDEFNDADGISDLKIGVFRSWPDKPGFYFDNVYLASPTNSDFRYWQHGLVMKIACATVYDRMWKYLSASLRTGAGGTVDAADAKDIEADVLDGIDVALVQPNNEEGTRGHISARQFFIDRTVDLLSTQELVGELAIQPLGYPKLITVRLGYKKIL